MVRRYVVETIGAKFFKTKEGRDKYISKLIEKGYKEDEIKTYVMYFN